ncbi:quinoprotein relay system zinc metallohydrolase 2 [Pararhizobium haloflavum]|uniref:quinoprotein relay system zinc metallohydrolase 2 n=1 Tax=Pararhizobium haloflavum TaxID=2037914 RepID=UPI000C196223|nr:quinoprotein relay system zinc metallohydrolase 2 [Pararhizobium haloflavum]
MAAGPVRRAASLIGAAGHDPRMAKAAPGNAHATGQWSSRAPRQLTRRRFLCVAGATSLSMCLCDGASLAAEADLPFREVEDGVFVRYGLQEAMSADNGGAIANIGFVVGETGVAVIDTGTTRQQGTALRAAVARVTDRPVTHLIATHVHLDHCFGHAAFDDLEPMNIGHRRLAGALAERGPFYRDQIRALSPDFADTDFRPPEVAVDDEMAIDLGGRRLQLKAWPAAHTDTDLTVFDEASGLLWASDLLFVGRLPTIDGSLNGWIDAMTQLVGPQARRVMPGHGPLVDGGDPAIEAQRAYLTTLRDQVRAAIEEGLDISETVDLLSRDTHSNWLLYGEGHGRNVTTAYAELEWE